jgi:hypothetical protein
MVNMFKEGYPRTTNHKMLLVTGYCLFIHHHGVSRLVDGRNLEQLQYMVQYHAILGFEATIAKPRS